MTKRQKPSRLVFELKDEPFLAESIESSERLNLKDYLVDLQRKLLGKKLSKKAKGHKK